MLSPIAADHAYNRRNQGPLENATHYGQVGLPGEGPFVSMWFIVEGCVIRSAAYQTHGCAWSLACASVLAQLLIGREVDQARRAEASDLDVILGGLPEGKGQYAEWSIAAMRNAL